MPGISKVCLYIHTVLLSTLYRNKESLLCGIISTMGFGTKPGLNCLLLYTVQHNVYHVFKFLSSLRVLPCVHYVLPKPYLSFTMFSCSLPPPSSSPTPLHLSLSLSLSIYLSTYLSQYYRYTSLKLSELEYI